MKIVNPIAKRGEDIACKYIATVGYKIIARNFRIRNGEVDIVAIDESEGVEKVLAFIEVKTRTSNSYGLPLEAITSGKLHSLTNVAQYYKLTHKLLPDSLRIDAISVKLSQIDNTYEIELVKNISKF